MDDSDALDPNDPNYTSNEVITLLFFSPTFVGTVARAPI